MKLRKGIIVRSQKYQENSKIVSVICYDGIISLLVRGSANMKSHNFAYSNELTKIEFDFQQKQENSFAILTQGRVLDAYSAIKADFSKLNDALIIIEAAYQLGNHLEDFPTFFGFLEQILDSLNQYNYNGYYEVIFRLKLLYLLGVGPVFSKCIVCGRREDLIGFDFLGGGMKCKSCFSGSSSYSQDTIAVLQFLYLTKNEFLTPDVLSKVPNQLPEVTEFLNQYYEHYLGYRSKAEKVIKKLKSN